MDAWTPAASDEGDGWLDDLSFSGREDLIEARRAASVAFEMRVAEAVVVVEDNRSKAITILDEQFDRGCILLRVIYGTALLRIADGTLEVIAIKSSSVDCNDLGADGHSLLVGRPIPQHAVDPTVRP
jgi:hypothetical protein